MTGEQNPKLDLIGISEKGPEDGGENHDISFIIFNSALFSMRET